MQNPGLDLPLHPSMVHPITGLPLRAVYVDSKGRARYPIMGGAPDDDGDGAADGSSDDDGADDGDDAGSDDDLGFPKKTPVAEMTADQKAAYFEHKASKEESRRKGLSRAVGGKTAEQIQADMAELEEFRKGKRTDGENAVKEAEDRVRAEERGKAGERIARATFEGALSHLEQKDRNEIINGLSLKNYIDDDGDVDAEKIRSYAARIAPVDTTTTPKRRDWGSGSRPPTGAEPKTKDKKSAGDGDGDAPPRRWGK